MDFFVTILPRLPLSASRLLSCCRHLYRWLLYRTVRVPVPDDMPDSRVEELFFRERV